MDDFHEQKTSVIINSIWMKRTTKFSKIILSSETLFSVSIILYIFRPIISFLLGNHLGYLDGTKSLIHRLCLVLTIVHLYLLKRTCDTQFEMTPINGRTIFVDSNRYLSVHILELVLVLKIWNMNSTTSNMNVSNQQVKFKLI